MKGGQRGGKKEAQAKAEKLLVDRGLLAPASTAMCGDRAYRIVRHSSGAALRYERLESKADERLRKKAEKRARRAGVQHMRANHEQVVRDCHNEQPPQSGPFGNGAEPEGSPLYQARLADYFRFQQRVLARLAKLFPSERWGYLKIGGENVLNGIKVGRVCGPDGQLYKIGSDIPTANAPIWTDDGIVQNDHGGEAADYFVKFEGDAGGGNGGNGGNGDPLPGGDIITLLEKLETQRLQLERIETFQKDLADLVAGGSNELDRRLVVLEGLARQERGIKLFGVKGTIAEIPKPKLGGVSRVPTSADASDE